MRVRNAEADGFVRAPPEGLGAALLHGPDAGLVRERAERLVRGVVPADPGREAFAVTVLNGGQITEDPARLADEAAALSLMGEARVVWLRGAQESHAETIARALSGPRAARLIVIEAGALRKSSPLRRLFEPGGPAKAAIECYPDDDRRLRRVITESLDEAGLVADDDALGYLDGVLGADRLATRAELAKLVAYMGDERRITRAHAEAAVGDSGVVTAEAAVLAAASGDLPGLERALTRAAAEGIAPTALVRTASTHFERLGRTLARIRAGEAPEAAIKRQRLHFTVAGAMAGQVRRWSPERVARAYGAFLEAEIAIKSADVPDRAIVEHALFAVALAARRGQSVPPRRRRMSSS